MSTTSSGIWTTVAMANLMQKGGSIFDLPQELVDNIVNLLDKPDLSTCSILCRPWYASARPKLFHTVFIHDHKQLNPYFESADKACPCGTAKDFNIQAFSIFLKDGFDTATIRWIKGLSIRGGAPRIPLQLAIDDVIDLLIQLPSLDSLHLIDILLPSGSTADVPTTRLMKILDLNGIHVPQGPVPEDSSLVVLPTGSPIDLLNLFSSVEELSLTDTKFSRWWEGSEGYPPHILQFFAEQASRIPDSFRISKLSASHGPIQQSQTMLLYLVNTSSSLAGLRSLDIDERPQTIRTLLKSVGSTLLCLHIDIDPRPMAGAIANEVRIVDLFLFASSGSRYPAAGRIRSTELHHHHRPPHYHSRHRKTEDCPAPPTLPPPKPHSRSPTFDD